MAFPIHSLTHILLLKKFTANISVLPLKSATKLLFTSTYSLAKRLKAVYVVITAFVCYHVLLIKAIGTYTSEISEPVTHKLLQQILYLYTWHVRLKGTQNYTGW